MKIIAFGHQKGVGKDTCAAFLKNIYLERHRGIKVKKAGFAKKIKEIVFQAFSWAGVKEEAYYDTHREEKEIVIPVLGKSPRQLWIEAGNKFREIYEDFPFDSLVQPSLLDRTDILLIPDLRYYPEVKRIKENGGLVIKVVNRNVPPTPDIADDALNSFTEWDYTIANEGSLKMLHIFLAGIANELYNG